MNVVGIDQSYTGFGLSMGGKAIKKSFPMSKYTTTEERLFDIENWLEKQLNGADDFIDLVVMEGYANAAKFGREAAGELGWAVKRTVFLATEEIPLVVPPTSLKKFVTGKGNAKKNEMLLGVFKQWGVEFSDDNQADAFALEKFGYAYILLRDEPKWVEQSAHLKKYQIEAVEKVRGV
jgi:Holliday junction resolvasome RuvABC endonuclease subunit